MPVLKALKSFPYNKARLQAGDLFKCPDKHVPVLIGYKLATLPEVVIAKPTQVYQTRHLEAASPGAPQMPGGRASVIKTPKTVAELREEAEKKGIHLPKGFIPKAELQRIIAVA